MFYLSRRQVHAVLAGAAAAGLYLATAELGSKKPVRVGGLLTLATLGMAGVLGSRASVKAITTENRLNAHIAATAPAVNLVNNGGTIGGDLTVSGNHTVSGNQTINGATSTINANQTVNGTQTVTGNHTINGSLGAGSGTLPMTSHLNMQGNSLRSVNDIGSSSGALGMSNGASMGSSLVMNNHDAFTFGKITAAKIGPGGNRTGIGSGATLSQCATRCDFLLTQLQGAGICY